MRRTKSWKQRLSILIAPLVAATASIATTSDQAGAANSNPDDDNDTVRAANGESTFELCTPDFGVGKFAIGPTTFTVEGADGQPITDITNLTFEITNGATAIDVTEFVLSVEELLSLEEDLEFTELLDESISSYTEPFKAPGLMALACSAGNNDTEEPEPFPAGTTITAKRSGVPIATADVSGRGYQLTDSPLLAILEDVFVSDGNCSLFFGPLVITGANVADDVVRATNGSEECSFTALYGALIDATGRRLHPSLAYMATFIPSLFASCYINNCDEDGFLGWPFLGVGSTTLTDITKNSLELQTSEIGINTPYNNEDELFCIVSRAMAFQPITPPDENQLPKFRITAIGRGMADALSDPNVNEWPEIDVCLVSFNQDDEVSNFAEAIGYISLVVVLQFFLAQMYLHDIPMGLVSSSLNLGAQSGLVQLNSLTRIPFAWEDGTLAPARVGRNYSDLVKANGTPVATYSVTSGALPRGLKLDSATGAITGKARRQGTFTFTITAANSAGSMSQQFTMNVKRIRPRVTAKREGSLVSFTGRVSPELRKKKVELQVFKYGAWRTVSQLDIKKNGTFTTSTITKWTQRYRVAAGSTRSAVVTK